MRGHAGKSVRIGFGTIAGIVFCLAAWATPAVAGEHGFHPWVITKAEWTPADEAGFGKFVQALGDSDCSSSESCLRSPANPYHKTDPAWFDVDLDCAKWPYFLRAYYAWKNGLPFSYVSDVMGNSDLKYGNKPNRPLSRDGLTDHGHGLDGPTALYALVNTVFSATYRNDAAQKGGVLPDFYSPAITPQAIRPGTVIYDINGHVGIVYRVDADGRIHYMDAHPDYTVTRSVYGGQFGQSPAKLGGGFKDWRPLKLVKAKPDEAGHLIGGHIEALPNDQIGDFSLAQYDGTEPNPKGGVKNARFAYKGIPLGFYEYVRAAVSGGKVTYNPIFELRETMRSLCNDFKDRAQTVDNATSQRVQLRDHPSRLPDNIYGTDDGEWEQYSTPSRDARLRSGFVQFRKDLGEMIDMWIHRDPRIVYDGLFLKEDLQKAYAEESAACSITYLNSAQKPVSLDFDSLAQRLTRMSFDPYLCIEHRWGAVGAEAATCTDGDAKQAWYADQQRLRNVTEPVYDVAMSFSREDLEHHKPGSGFDKAPDMDVKAMIDRIGPQIPFSGMAAVGR